MMETVATLSVAEVRTRFQRVSGSEMLYAPFDQGTPEWHVARVGVTTASTFSDAREFCATNWIRPRRSRRADSEPGFHR